VKRVLPVLARNIPVAQIPPRNLGSKGRSRARRNSQAIESSQHDLRVLWTTEADVELWYFVSDHFSGIGDGRADGEHHIVELRVAAWSRAAAGCEVWLGTAVVATGWESIILSVEGIAA